MGQGAIKDDRLQKLAEIKKLGVNPYPSKIGLKGERITTVEALDCLGKKVLIGGRIWAMRGHGGLTFVDIKDAVGQIQALFQEKALGEKYKTLFPLLDTGDFVAVLGEIIKTQAGEITVSVADFQLLSKAIRNLPPKWSGLTDPEERYRRRYVDLLFNDDLQDLFKKKAIFWQSMREFMLEKAFTEVETPVLEISAGGADASPFVTHHNALDVDYFLRISMGELWQKRLMVGGFEKTFEIGRQFRNEGLSREHLQDYTQMEFYWAYANYEDSMRLVEELYKYVAKKTFGTFQFEIDGKKVDLSGDWKRIDYRQTILKELGIDITEASTDELKKKCDELKIKTEKNADKSRLIDNLWKEVRKSLLGPVFLTGHPVEISPLAKRMEKEESLVERYQVILAGSEMGNGYSELNDPVDQNIRFEKQQKLREAGDSEAQMHDRDFVEALEYGMPPVTGFGVSERLFSFLADKSVRECVLFPLMRPLKVTPYTVVTK